MSGTTIPPESASPSASLEGRGAAVEGQCSRVTLLGVLALLALTFAAYQPVWHAGFIWDDDTMLTENRAVQASNGLRTIWFSTELPDYFPVTSTAFWLQWRLFGPNPLGYHLVNVMLHAVAAILWWRVLVRLALPGAWVAAALFAVHPVNVESVAWVSELKNTLAMVFFTLTLAAYLRFEDNGRARWYGAALAAFALALLSKTAVAPFPLVLLGFAWWRRGRVGAEDLRRALPFFALAAALAVVTIWFQYVRAIGSTEVRTDGFWARLAGAGWAVWFYLGKALVPTQLAIVYPRWQIDPGQVWAFVPGLLVVALGLCCWRLRARWGRGPLFAWGYFVAMLLPILGFLNIGAMRYSLVADRWQYFAIVAPLAIVVAVSSKLMPRGVVRGAVGGAIILVLAAATWRQAQCYRDPATMWRVTLARNPECSIAHNEMGKMLSDEGRFDEAMTHFRRALEILPNYEVAHYNHGCALLAKNDVAGAIRAFRRSVASEPGFFPARYNLGTTLLSLGQLEEATEHLQRAVEISPDAAEAHNNIAAALLEQGLAERAVAHYEHAIAADPKHASARRNLGWMLLQQGRTDEALAQLTAAVELQPDDAMTRRHFAQALLRRGDIPTAIAHLERAVALAPRDVSFRVDLGDALTSVGRLSDAIAQLRRAIEIAPRDPDAHNNLANALLQAGAVEEARSHYEQTLALEPAHARAHNNLGWVSFHTNRADAAVIHLRKAVEIEPGYGNAHRNLGDVLLALGNVEEAIGALEKAIALQPDDETARRSLERALAKRKSARRGGS